MRRGALSPVEVLEATIARIRRLDPSLNAFITVMAEEAAAAAREAEREMRAGTWRGPLHGVPIALKDLIDTAGVRTTAGSPVFSDRVPARDARVVERLRAAGAVLVGKTNMYEFAYGDPHPRFGAVHNPWDLARDTSGSSSGSAAAVSAGLCFGALGSDTGGSIRFPAAWCGLVGLKPTYDLVSRDGVVPLSWTLDHVGPMARTVRDAAILLHAMADVGQDGPGGLDAPLGGLRLGVVAEVLPLVQDADVRQAFAAALDRLGALGASVREVHTPDPSLATAAVLAILYAEASSYHEPFLRAHAAEYCDEVRIRLEVGARLPALDYLRGRRAQWSLTQQYRALFSEVDVLVLPTSPIPAQRPGTGTGSPAPDSPDAMEPFLRFTSPFNLTGLPALSIPCGLTRDGLPVGLQLAGPPSGDALLLRVGHAFEADCGGFARPPAPFGPSAKE